MLWPFMHRPSFDTQVSRLFGSSLGQEKLDDDYLGLIHAVVALGQRHDSNLAEPSSGTFGTRKWRGYVKPSYWHCL